MITKVIMPQLSLSMRVGLVTRWYKPEGSYVNQGEPLCEIEGDKAVIEIEAPSSGYLLKTVAQEAEEFPVREVMAYIGETSDLPELVGQGAAPLDAEQPASSASAPATPVSNAGDGAVKASPVAKRIAQELGVDLAGIQGTGVDGLIQRSDVLAAKEKMGKEAPVAPTSHPKTEALEIKLTGIKKIVAERMKASYLDAPHIELVLAVDMQNASQVRDRVNQAASAAPHVTFSDLFVWTVARTLQTHPLLNAFLREDTIVFPSEINIGLATETEKGLVVPVIRDADQSTIFQIASQRLEVIERVRSSKQTIEDLSAGTFTITNLGMYAIDSFKPIIMPGQSAILGVGRIKNEPVADGDAKIYVRPMITLTLACDHRVVDGADGAKFLSDLKVMLENPEGLTSML